LLAALKAATSILPNSSNFNFFIFQRYFDLVKPQLEFNFFIFALGKSYTTSSL